MENMAAHLVFTNNVTHWNMNPYQYNYLKYGYQSLGM